MAIDAKKLYQSIKQGKIVFDEGIHCPKIIQVMADPDRATMSAFCVEVGISERRFYEWKKASRLFDECYEFGKMCSREIWEEEGRKLMNQVSLPGTTNNGFEYWKLIGWSRFGISKNSRIRLDLDENSTPDKHYSQLIRQASNGDFTAGEIKQLMEAINVGLNTHQVFQLQKQINDLNNDLATMKENSDGDNRLTDKGTKKKD